MEENKPAPSKGYQKKINKDEIKASSPKPKGSVDYSSPNAKKWPAMIEAIETGNEDVVRQFIEEGLNVNLSHEGVTPLMLAASKGRVEVAVLILNAGVNINEILDDGETALHKAAFDQSGIGIVELLLVSGIDLDVKNKAGKTALNLAEESKHIDVVRVIKKHQQQRQVDAKEWQDFLNSPEGKPFKQQQFLDTLSTVPRLWWLPPLVLGVAGFALGLVFGSIQIGLVIGLFLGGLVDLAFFIVEQKTVKYLEKIGPLPFLDGHTLRQKRKAGEPIFASPRDKGGPPDEPAAEPQASAAVIADGPSLENQPPDLSRIDESATFEKPAKSVDLSWAIYVVVVLMIALLLGAGFMYRDPLMRWYYTKRLELTGVPFTDQAFLDAAAMNNEEVVALFIRAGVNADAKNEKGQTALMLASEKGHVAMLKKLSGLNADAVNRADKNGSTALMIAARLGQEQAVRALVEGGANVNFLVSSAEGAATALQAVLDAPEFKDEHEKIFSYLVQKGADVKARSKSGRSALFFAAERGWADAAAVLIEKGAEVNGVDADGGFPLLSATCKGYTRFVTLLAEKGANMQMATPDGRTPLMCAVREGHGETVKLLLEKGAAVNAKSKSGDTALTEATRSGNVDATRLLLGKGADADSGWVPDSFSALSGKLIVLNLKKTSVGEVLKRVAQTASQDGYTINVESKRGEKMNAALKAPWNKVLQELAKKNRLVLVVKDKTVYVLP